MTQLTTTGTGTTVSQQSERLTLSQYKGRRAAHAVQPRLTVLLADISGSMAGSKIQALNNALRQIWRPEFRCIGFSEQLYEIEESDIGSIPAIADTCMLLALEEAWSPQTAASHIVLLSDGIPTDANEKQILDAAQQHRTVPIDTIGISESNTDRNYSASFLQQLSAMTGGRFMRVDQPLELTATLQYLLDWQPEGTEGAIRL